MVEWRDRGFVQDSDQEEEAEIGSEDSQDQNAHLRDATLNLAQHTQVHVEDGERAKISVAVVVEQPRRRKNVNVHTRDQTYQHVIAAELHEDREQESITAHIEVGALQLEIQDTPGKGAHGDEVHAEPITSAGNSTKTHLALSIHAANELPSTSTHNPSHDIFDVPSSPLSELATTSPMIIHRFVRQLPQPFSPLRHEPSSSARSDQLPLTGRSLHSPTTSRSSLTPTTILSLSHIPDVDQNVGNLQEYEQHTHPRRRNFRPRNPIQLHPYALENEQYRNTLRARGIRPVTVAGLHSEQAVPPKEAVSQDVFHGNRSSPLELSPPSSLYSSPSSLRSGNHYGDDNFEPGKTPLLQPNLETHDPHRGVPRTMSSVPRAERMSSFERELFRELTTSPNGPKTMTSTSNAKSFPQLSKVVKPRATKKKFRLKRFRVPTGFSKSQLPTPDMSSEASKAQRSDHDTETESEADSGADDAADILEIGREETSSPLQDTARIRTSSPISISSNSSSDESEQFRAAQRRIRGVLPASYLTLNQRAQQQAARKSGAKAIATASTSRDAQLRGLARRIPTNHIRSKSERSSSTPDPELSEKSDGDQRLGSDLRKSSPGRQEVRQSVTQINLRNDAATQDILEEDWIDTMAPAVSRNRVNSKARPKQLKLGHAFRPPPNGFVTNSLVNSSSLLGSRGPSRAVDRRRHRTERARRKQLPKLSIIDSATQLPLGSKPDFVKVAVRQARSRGDGGRDRPSGKIISMHDRRDEMEMQNTLDEWTTGRTFSQYDPPNELARIRIQRKPLSELSKNQQQTFPSPVKLAHPAAVNPPQRARQGRLGSLAARPRLRQTRLEIPGRDREDDPSQAVLQNLKHGGRNRTKMTSQVQRCENGRPGQLEDLQAENDNQHHDVAFHRNLSALDSRFDHRRTYHQRIANPLLNTYLNGKKGGRLATAMSASQVTFIKESGASISSTGQREIVRQPRKRRPQRSMVEDFEIDFAPSPDALTTNATAPVVTHVSSSHYHLGGLGKIGTFYTSDFGVEHLGVGTYFHHDTFIGSGELEAALAIRQRDLDCPARAMLSNIGVSQFRWGSWTDKVSSQLSDILCDVRLVAEPVMTSQTPPVDVLKSAISSSSVFSTLRSISRYFASHIYFLDAVDRVSFLGRTLQDVESLCHSLHESSNITLQSGVRSTQEYASRLSTHTVVMLYQLQRIAQHPLVENQIKTRIELLLKSTTQSLVKRLLANDLHVIWGFLSISQQQLVSQSGIRDDAVEVECIVVLFHVLEDLRLTGFDFWNALRPAFEQRSLSNCSDIKIFEKTWHDIFSILPLLDFDTSGVLRPSTKQVSSTGSWTVVKVMLSRLFDLYSNDTGNGGPSMNSYIRANLNRCYNLVRVWKWTSSEPILNCTFDFFARNGLALLRNEESRGSPTFLANLSSDVAIDLQPSDRSFDIFLKILVVSLKAMCVTYTEKKLKSIAWRFVPNGGRLLEKEKELLHHDLNMRRNHHDLLCVLYSTLPPASRPNLDLLKDMVNFVSSHSEICRINIRSWANLAKFQLSADEPEQTLDRFAVWYNKMLEEMMMQHRNARVEAESQFEASKAEGTSLTTDLLDSTVASNQKQTEGLMVMALALLADCFKNGKNISAVARLFRTVEIASVLDMFNPGLSRYNTVIMEALHVYDVYIERLEQVHCSPIQHPSNEDSQEFGDWSALEDIIHDSAQSDLHVVEETTIVTIHTLLSNCFGAESFFDETLLSKLTETWIQLCKFLVSSGQRDWGYYLNAHSQGSWHQLRSTDQTRKFSPYFVCSILQLNDSKVTKYKEVLIAEWMISLVERESMLKFQGHFTSALLNAYPGDVLLQNLPFAMDPCTRVFNISLNSLRDRRLGLISAVLSNIRANYETAFLRSSSETQRLRTEYTAVLKPFMNAMKNNYQETQQGSSTRGAYVEFVQKVIEFLQQYTNPICPVDAFFTDSAAFPLPLTDPAYIVGRLKGYSFGLSDSGTQKKLAIFFQSICERAALDHQQAYLGEQLKKAVEGIHERGGTSAPSLRATLILGILPAYMDLAFTTEFGWILANVFLEASTYIFDDLMFHFSVTNKDSLQATSNLLTGFLQASWRMINHADTNLDLLIHPHVLRTLTSIYRTVTRTTITVDYIHRYSTAATQSVAIIRRFIEFGNLTLAYFNNDPRPAVLLIHQHIQFLASSYTDLQAFCKSALETALLKNWVKDDQGYHVVRGTSRADVVIDVRSLDQEKAKLIETIEEFFCELARIPTFKSAVSSRQEDVALFDLSTFM